MIRLVVETVYHFLGHDLDNSIPSREKNFRTKIAHAYDPVIQTCVIIPFSISFM